MHPEATSEREAARRYLNLLKACLTRELFAEEEVVDVLAWKPGGPLGDPDVVWPALHEAGLRIVRPFEDRQARDDGRDWPANAETMVGRARLENIEKLVTTVLAEQIPGDLVETGVWRGGTVILMRAVLAAYGDPDRCVWVCDSFEGLPDADPERFPADDAMRITDELAARWTSKVLAVPLDVVRSNFARYDLLDDRVRFLAGWFADTLPSAPIEQIAVLRLDGDLYESTIDALVPLEPKVSPGGYVIVDDYFGLEACAAAVDDYRTEHGISAPIERIDWTGAWWRKEG